MIAFTKCEGDPSIAVKIGCVVGMSNAALCRRRSGKPEIAEQRVERDTEKNPHCRKRQPGATPDLRQARA